MDHAQSEKIAERARELRSLIAEVEINGKKVDQANLDQVILAAYELGRRAYLDERLIQIADDLHLKRIK